ncbi:hypothetical protein [Lysobacter claricitrinus]|uniref:hypothetical protein n=1 Tax=Lysobacter claricitrinus TaxID=3367728 RepID=UPI0037DBDC7F
MKVQFDGDEVRVRLTRAEFDSLRDGARLRVRLDWPRGAWSLAVAVADAFALNGEGGDVDVVLPRADLDDLASRLPARDGLHYMVDRPDGALALRIEVDLHDGRARRR